MRQIVKKGEVAHLWAHSLQEKAYTQTRNFYFENNTIYSYGKHFPIATLDKNNLNIVYFTTRTYSNTTSKHINYVSQAINNKEIIYCMNPEEANRNYHTLNLESFNNFCKSIIRYKLINSRKPEIYLNQIAYQKDLFIKYVNHFNIKKSIYKKYKYVFIDSKELGIKITKKEVLAQIKYKKEQELQLIKNNKEEILLFKNFKKHRIYNRINSDYLRYNKNKKQIETSQEVIIPLQIAKKTYKYIKNILKNKDFKESYDYLILSFKINEINNNFIKVGCHKIEIKEINKIAKELNW